MVEDSPTQAARLKFQLEGQGYRVRVANRGEQAIELCQEEAPDLLITDVTMPGMDGYELCRAVKSDEGMRIIPVMLLTGLSDPQDIIWGLEAGADCYLTKPYTDEELFNRIEFVLANVSSDELEDAAETEPIDVTFLGQSHVITSTRKQMLNLLLSTYESAARRNEHLDKNQLKMKIDLKESERRAEMAEASLTIAQAQLEESEEGWKELVTALPLPVFVFEDEDLVCHSKAGESMVSEGVSLESLRAGGVSESEIEVAGSDLRLLASFDGSSAPAPAPSSASLPSESSETIEMSAALKRAFVEKFSAAVSHHLDDTRTQLDQPEADLEKVKAALSKVATTDLLRWESLDFQLNQQEQNLKELVVSAVDSHVLQSVAIAQGQSLKVAELPDATFVGDGARVTEALREVMDNALRFGPHNSEVEVTLSKEDETWVITVTDQGSGPPDELKADFLKPFYASSQGGLGLGLTYAQQVCKSHGGELKTSADKGFAVSLCLSAESA